MSLVVSEGEEGKTCFNYTVRSSSEGKERDGTWAKETKKERKKGTCL